MRNIITLFVSHYCKCSWDAIPILAFSATECEHNQNCPEREFLESLSRLKDANRMHHIQRPRYQRGSLCQDPAGYWTTQRPPDHRKEMQTEVVWTHLLFIRSSQNHFEWHSERGKKTWQTEEGGGKTTSGNGHAWSSPSPRGQWRTEKNGGNWL